MVNYLKTYSLAFSFCFVKHSSPAPPSKWNERRRRKNDFINPWYLVRSACLSTNVVRALKWFSPILSRRPSAIVAIPIQYFPRLQLNLLDSRSDWGVNSLMIFHMKDWLGLRYSRFFGFSFKRSLITGKWSENTKITIRIRTMKPAPPLMDWSLPQKTS